jgi:hypothetical protein
MFWSPYPSTPAIIDRGLRERIEQELGRKKYKLDTVYALQATESIIQVLAGRHRSFFGRFYRAKYSLPSWEVQREEYKESLQWFYGGREEIVTANQMDLNDKIKDIRLYQGGLEEVAAVLGKELELVDTGKPQTFIKVEKRDGSYASILPDTDWLRLEAFKLHADAVIHYQPGSAIGTPVRIKR